MNLHGDRSTLLICVLAAGLLPADADAARIAHWTFDDGSGTTLTERVGGQHGTLVNFPGDGSEWVSGVFGRALRFDGVNDYVAHPVPLPREQGTLGHWLMAEDTAFRVLTYESDSPDGATDYNGFGSSGDALEYHSGASTGWSFYLQDGPGPANSNGRWSVGGGTVVPGVWTHVAATWDRTGDLVLYVNCVEVARTDISGGTFSNHTTRESYFGRPSQSTRYWKGRMDDVQIFDHAMTPAVIQDAFCKVQEQLEQQLSSGSLDPVEFPDSVAMADSGLVLGNTATGQVLRFDKHSSGTYQQVQQFLSAEPIGEVIAYDGNKVAWSWEAAPSWNVQIFDTSNSSLQTISAPAGADLQTFGRAFDIDGDWLAISASGEAGVTDGEIYLYRFDSGTWQLRQTITEGAFEWGNHVDLSLPFLAATGPGRTAVYRLQPDDTFSFILWTAGGPSRGTVAVDGRFMAVARQTVPPQVRIYSLEPCCLDTDVYPPANLPDDGFGQTLALRGKHLVVGTRPDPGNPNEAANVYLYQNAGDGWPFQRRLTLDSWDSESEGFGHAVAVNATDIVVLAPQRDVLGNPDVGVAFLFDTPVFIDGFESGDTAAWATTLP